MPNETIAQIAEKFGLVIEPVVAAPSDETSYRLFKGVNEIHAGSEESVREFLAKYEYERPGLFHESMFGYRE